MTMRHDTRALTLAVALILAGASSAEAQERLELFDAHMHWNQEPDPFYSLEQILAVFKRNGVTGILATSRPNKGTNQLVDAKVLGPDAFQRRKPAAEYVVAAGEEAGTVQRPQVRDFLDHAQRFLVAARVAANAARVAGVDIAAGRTGRELLLDRL